MAEVPQQTKTGTISAFVKFVSKRVDGSRGPFHRIRVAIGKEWSTIQIPLPMMPSNLKKGDFISCHGNITTLSGEIYLFTDRVEAVMLAEDMTDEQPSSPQRGSRRSGQSGYGRNQRQGSGGQSRREHQRDDRGAAPESGAGRSQPQANDPPYPDEPVMDPEPVMVDEIPHPEDIDGVPMPGFDGVPDEIDTGMVSPDPEPEPAPEPDPPRGENHDPERRKPSRKGYGSNGEGNRKQGGGYASNRRKRQRPPDEQPERPHSQGYGSNGGYGSNAGYGSNRRKRRETRDDGEQRPPRREPLKRPGYASNRR